ncbi:MAG: hypothetical protein NVS3B7_19410 [Candidatus Elarobacter sp.]
MNPPEGPFGAAYAIQKIDAKIDRVIDSLAGLANKAEVAFISARVDSFVPRTELETHWNGDERRLKYMEDHFDALEATIKENAEANKDRFDGIDRKLEESARNRLPPWMLPVLIAAAPIVVNLVTHMIWK